jgi:16S rRNA (adenine1518-N6/adenine1519-N6)-dimethyltransferase
MDRREIAAVLASSGLRPQHQFGQNFMIDQRILAGIVEAGGIEPHDVILEVGPGAGNLTRLLSQAVPRGAVLAVDIDRKLLPAARAHHAALSNVTWLLADVLAGKHAVEPAVVAELRRLRRAHPAGTIRLVSNLPYNAASPLVAELLVEMWRSLASPEPLMFSRLAFTVQWEVGLRMSAAPDSRDYGPLGILLQALARVEIIRKIPPGAFWPPPKIHSALVAVTPDAGRMRAISDVPAFQELLAGIFSHRRQTLGNGLKHHLGKEQFAVRGPLLQSAGFDLALRPEMLTVSELLRLAAILA